MKTNRFSTLPFAPCALFEYTLNTIYVNKLIFFKKLLNIEMKFPCIIYFHVLYSNGFLESKYSFIFLIYYQPKPNSFSMNVFYIMGLHYFNNDLLFIWA